MMPSEQHCTGTGIQREWFRVQMEISGLHSLILLQFSSSEIKHKKKEKCLSKAKHSMTNMTGGHGDMTVTELLNILKNITIS